MKRAQFVAAVLCALVAGGLMCTAVYHGQWMWAALCGLGFAVFVVLAFCAAVRIEIRKGGV